MKRPSPPIAAIVFAALLGTILFSVLPALAAPILTITPITWNVVGLDSNNVTVGPNNFPVGARVCNTGDTAATNVTSAFIWDTADAFIDLRPGSKSSYTGADAVASLAASSCHDFYYEVQITRSSSAYDHTRRYHITATADTLGVSSTPTPREIYVEFLISQSRNSTDDVKLDTVSIPAGGTMTLVVGGTYDIELIASTATNGYEQIESFINFPNTIFQVNTVAASYTADGGTDPDALTKLYADGCSWENDPNSPNYRSCLSTGKYGGNVTINYNVTIIGGGGTTETLNTLIYDFSGSSYHYNSDFASSARIAAIIDPTAMTISKSFSPDPAIVGGITTLTFTIGNPNAAPITDVNFSDMFPSSPGAMVVANPTGASTTGCGTPTFAPVAGADSISFSDGTVPANGNCLVSVNVTVPVEGTYNNTSDNLFVGTTDTGKNASDSVVVGTDPITPSPACGLVMAEWTFAGITTVPPQPAPSSQAPDVSTAAISVGGTSPGSLTMEADTTSGNPAESLLTYGWPKDPSVPPPVDTATFPFIQFAIDTSNYTQVNLTFDADRKSNGPDMDSVFFSTDGLSWTLEDTFMSAVGWTTFGPYDFTGDTSTTGTTFFRIYGYGANTDSKGADLSFDNISFTGCGFPNPPSISKSFSPDPVAVGDTSSLSFTITNPNSTIALGGIAFTDTMPAGVTVADGSTLECGGTLTTTAATSTISLSGGALAADSNCVFAVTVTVTTSGPHLNVSGFISAAETGTNTGPGGSASDSITAISPPSISKLFNPNPILTGGTSTLTFTLSNPNPDDQLTGVAFSDTFPTSPGAMAVASPTGASTSGCGTPAYTPIVAAVSISFSGGTIAAGGTCTVTVDVTATPTGDYANTSGAVSATTAGTGNTASDTLTVNPVNPGISILKQVGTSATGPWTTFVAVAAGTNIYYQMTVENIGDVPLTDADVTDPTLAGLGVNLSGCAWANLPLFDVQTCVVGPVTAVAGSNANTASSHGTYIAADVDSTPSIATYATTGLTLTKSVTESFYSAAGDTLNYSYLVSNNGSAPLAGPVVISDDQSTDESCPDVSTVGDFDAFLDPGESITCTATYTITAGDVTAGSVTNTASATVDGVISNEDDETVFVNLPELQVSKANDTSGSSPVGATFDWTLTVANLGPVDATFTDTQTIVSDPLPAGATYGSPPTATASNFTDITNSGNIICTIDGSNVLTCVVIGASVMIGGTTGSFTVTVSVTPTVAGSLPNTATVDPNNVISEGDETNNTDSDTVTAIGPPSIAKSFSPDTITVGSTSTLQFTIANSNAGIALTGVAFVDTLPAGATVPSAITSVCGGTLTVTAPDSIAFSGGTIAAGGSCIFSVIVTGATVGVKVNTSGAVSSTNGGTGNTANDTLTVSAPLVTDPAVTKSVSPTAAAIGDTVTYTLFVTNAGPGDADDVIVTDVIPAFLDISSVVVDPSGPGIAIAGNTITLTFGTVTPSDNYEVTITTLVNSLGAPPGGDNQADLTTSSTDSDPDNNSDVATLTIFVPSAPMAPETGFAPNRRTAIPAQTKAYQAYGELTLEIPALGLEMTVVGIPRGPEGWDVTWLADQAGYLAGTAFPTWSGNSVITGHKSLPSGIDGPFARLHELEYGDQLVITAWGMRYVYEIREEEVVRPRDPGIFRHEEQSWVTLLTCDAWDEPTESYLTRRLVRAALMRIEPPEIAALGG